MQRLVEKHRPKKIDNLINQKHVKKGLKNFLSRGDVPHMLFIGPPGCGKTSAAMAFARELFGKGWESKFMELNASDERGINTIRNKVKRYCKMKGRRILFLDEMEQLTKQAQMALRRTMEKTSDTILIGTANHLYKIIKAIRSRYSIFRFNRLKNKDMWKRIKKILQKEGVDYPKTREVGEAFMTLIDQANGDMRYALNKIEKLIGEGKKISKRNILMMTKVEKARDAMRKAIQGNFDEAKDLIEEAYLDYSYSYDKIISEMFKELEEEDYNKKVKIRLYDKLSDTLSKCSNGQNPLIHLTGFLSYCWVVKHLPRKCPAKQ